MSRKRRTTAGVARVWWTRAQRLARLRHDDEAGAWTLGGRRRGLSADDSPGLTVCSVSTTHRPTLGSPPPRSSERAQQSSAPLAVREHEFSADRLRAHLRDVRGLMHRATEADAARRRCHQQGERERPTDSLVPHRLSMSDHRARRSRRRPAPPALEVPIGVVANVPGPPIGQAPSALCSKSLHRTRGASPVRGWGHRVWRRRLLPRDRHASVRCSVAAPTWVDQDEI